MEYKIAVIDDREEVRKAFKETYAGLYEIVEADTGKSGEELIRQERDKLLLVILDLEMPYERGGEMKKIGGDLAKLCNDLKIPHLIVTQYYHGGNMTRLYAGYNSYKEKESFEIRGVKENPETWKDLGEFLKYTPQETISAIERYITKVKRPLHEYIGLTLEVVSLSIFAALYKEK